MNPNQPQTPNQSTNPPSAPQAPRFADANAAKQELLNTFSGFFSKPSEKHPECAPYFKQFSRLMSIGQSPDNAFKIVESNIMKAISDGKIEPEKGSNILRAFKNTFKNGVVSKETQKQLGDTWHLLYHKLGSYLGIPQVCNHMMSNLDVLNPLTPNQPFAYTDFVGGSQSMQGIDALNPFSNGKATAPKK
jgi:hypothetical protein